MLGFHNNFIMFKVILFGWLKIFKSIVENDQGTDWLTYYWGIEAPCWSLKNNFTAVTQQLRSNNIERKAIIIVY